VPAGPLLEVAGAFTSPVLAAKRILLAALRLNVGVPLASKKWFPSTLSGPLLESKEPEGTAWLTAMGGMACTALMLAYAREVASKRVAIAPVAVEFAPAAKQV